MPSRDVEPDDPSPASLFAAWLVRHEAGEDADLESLCGAHPDAAAELRNLHRHWKEIDAFLRQHGLGGSLTERIRARHGSDVDPQVTLEAEEPGSGLLSEVLSRLSGRTSASTAPNPFGLHDVHGNVCELCLDGWDTDFYAGSPRVEPVAPWAERDFRVLRGTYYKGRVVDGRSAHRRGGVAGARGDVTGVWPARALVP